MSEVGKVGSYELLPEERETHFNMSGDNHNEFIVFSDDPYWVRRLDKIAEGKIIGAGKEYRLRADQVLVRAGKPQREYTDAQRAAMSERAKFMGKNTTVNHVLHRQPVTADV